MISIITPTFNASKCIEQCLQSVISQSFSNWEHIIVDGYSTDGTQDLLKKYPHLRWVSEPDEGIYFAMNKGVQMAKGEWIYFLGADDMLYDNYVLEKISYELNNGVEVLYGNVLSTRWNGLYDGEFNWKKILQKNICHQSVFIRKSVFEKIGYFNIKYKVYADWEHNWRWFFNNQISKKYIPLTIANYADGGFSSINPKDEVFFQEKSKNLKKLVNVEQWRFYKSKRILGLEKEAISNRQCIKGLYLKFKKFCFLFLSRCLLFWKL